MSRSINAALEKYRPGQAEPILVGGKKVLKQGLRLMAWFAKTAATHLNQMRFQPKGGPPAQGYRLRLKRP